MYIHVYTSAIATCADKDNGNTCVLQLVLIGIMYILLQLVNKESCITATYADYYCNL